MSSHDFSAHAVSQNGAKRSDLARALLKEMRRFRKEIRELRKQLASELAPAHRSAPVLPLGRRAGIGEPARAPKTSRQPLEAPRFRARDTASLAQFVPDPGFGGRALAVEPHPAERHDHAADDGRLAAPAGPGEPYTGSPVVRGREGSERDPAAGRARSVSQASVSDFEA